MAPIFPPEKIQEVALRASHIANAAQADVVKIRRILEEIAPELTRKYFK